MPFITGVPVPDVRLFNVTCKGLLWKTVIVVRYLNGNIVVRELLTVLTLCYPVLDSVGVWVFY